MPIFHLFTVRPVVVAPFESPRVRYRDFMINAATVETAWAHIEASEGTDICEAWGAPRTSEGETFVITGPDTEMSREHEADQHLHWVRAQERYSLVHSGPLSLHEWQAQQRARYLAGSRPNLQLVTGGMDPAKKPGDRSGAPAPVASGGADATSGKVSSEPTDV